MEGTVNAACDLQFYPEKNRGGEAVACKCSKLKRIPIARKGNTYSSVVMVSSSGLPVACLLVAGSPKSFNLEKRILHLPTTTLHRDQVPGIR